MLDAPQSLSSRIPPLSQGLPLKECRPVQALSSETCHISIEVAYGLGAHD